ncbi:MAG: LarC family nickel insertion protein, partial [Thermovirgaceae bacterium]
MKRILYLNCFSGISGDMLLGTLLDLLEEKDLAPYVKGLALEKYDVTVSTSRKKGITGLDVKVRADEGHPHRGLKDVLEIIEKSELSPFVKQKAEQAFRLIADAEGKIHGMSFDEVHFHEVGAVDSIVDIVGACALVETLSTDHIAASPVNVGWGTVMCAHGEFPVPAPATLKLLEGIPVYSRGEPLERTTPTGAVLLKVFAEGYGPMPAGFLERTGYGLGDHESDLPNLLQGILLKSDEFARQ